MMDKLSGKINSKEARMYPLIPEECYIPKNYSIIPIIWNIKEDIDFNNKFFKPSTMEKQQTEGERRVRKSFNPSALKRVEAFKALTAEAIDNLEELSRRVKNAPNELGDDIGNDIGDFMREVATAKTQLQIASMCGVAALTHYITFKRLDNDLLVGNNTPEINTASSLPPHQQRVITERDELITKLTALGKFISDNPVYPTLPKEEQEDLIVQHRLMHQYHNVLNNRISRF